jgi:hypothetical protein
MLHRCDLRPGVIDLQLIEGTAAEQHANKTSTQISNIRGSHGRANVQFGFELE